MNHIDLLETVCERMQQVGLIHSKADFSERMLGKGPSYLTSMRSRNRNVPEEVFSFFISQLETEVEDGEHKLVAATDELQRKTLQQKHRADLLVHARHSKQHMHNPVAEQEKGKPHRSIVSLCRRLFR
ncbi:hypothetical protein ACO34A_15595 [Rhizobium sp. ACO-34A]|nr:DUF6626 family protein [Rhizobium sp. ACO-34A]ATN35227.1 hypothetical protein ACO34A_15595 [Rhizobium sp. ACO-34A]